MGDEKWEEALRSLQRFLSLDDQPQSRIQALHNIGACYLAMERYDEALATLDEIKVMTTDDPDLAFSRAVALACAGYHEQAIAAFQTFAEQWPERAHTLEVAGNLDQLQRSLHGEAPPRAFLVDHLLEQISHNQETGDFHLIEQKAKRMIAADPTRPEGYFHLGVACQETKRPEEALKAFLVANDLAPDHAPTLYNLANAYLHLQEPDPALPLLRRCLEVDHDKPAVLSLLGQAHLQLGDRERAIDYWRNALQADPTFGPAQWRLFVVGEGPEPAEAPLTPTHLQLQAMSPVVKARMRRPAVRRSGEIVLTLDPEVGFVLEDHKNRRNGTIHAGSPFRVYHSVPREDLLDLIGMIKLLMALINTQNTRDIAILAYYAQHDNFNYQARFEDGEEVESSTYGRFIVDEAPRFFKIRIDSDLSTPFGDPMQGKLIYLSQGAKPGFMVSTMGLEAVDEEIPRFRLRG